MAAEKFIPLDIVKYVKLAQKIRVVGAKEKDLDSHQELVVTAIRDFVAHIIEGNDLAENYLLADDLESIPEGTLVMLGVDKWQRVFNQQKGDYYFRPEDLSCELLRIIGRDEEIQITLFDSLSSAWGLVGLSQDEMNRDGITYQGRVKLLREALVDSKLSIGCLKTRMTRCNNKYGSAIIGKRL